MRDWLAVQRIFHNEPDLLHKLKLAQTTEMDGGIILKKLNFLACLNAEKQGLTFWQFWRKCEVCNFYYKEFFLKTKNKYVNSFDSMQSLQRKNPAAVAAIDCVLQP